MSTCTLVRHSRITHLIKQGMKESVIKLMMWGNINTNMFMTYAHLTGSDIDQEVLGQYGIAPKKEEEKACLEPIQCPHCSSINTPLARYSTIYGRSLSEDAISTMEGMNYDVMSHPELVKILLNELMEERWGK